MIDCEAILASWVLLNANLMKMNEKECLAVLAAEKRGKRRRQFILRIDSRINRLRNQRNRQLLLDELDNAARG